MLFSQLSDNKPSSSKYVYSLLSCLIFCFLLIVTNVQGTNNNEVQQCNYQLVESMPEKLTYKEPLPFNIGKTHEVFLKFIKEAKKTIKITTFELTLLKQSTDPDSPFHESMKAGQDVASALVEAAHDRNVDVEIIFGLKNCTSNYEFDYLKAAGIKIKFLDITKMLGKGVQHAKMIITDGENLYLGSSNWDWQSLTQVKEMGISYEKCPVLAADLSKIFLSWSIAADLGYIPNDMPELALTKFNANNPITIKMDDTKTQVYFASSPKILDGQKNERTQDLDAILETIEKAEKFIHISVMNYGLLTFGTRIYHPEIENALKKANFERNVEVKLLFSIDHKKKLRPTEARIYKSLDALRSNFKINHGIAVKLYSLPDYDEFQESLKYARVKHDKYIVTDNSVYIGTSNWTPDYFENTCGVGISIRPDPKDRKGMDVVEKLEMVFERDYNSEYTVYATDYKY